MWTLSALRQQREAILSVARRRGMAHVRVFGSISRGDATTASDVDFLVEVEPGRSLFDLGGFIADLQDLLGCHVDVVSDRGLRPRFRDRVLREAVPL